MVPMPKVPSMGPSQGMPIGNRLPESRQGIKKEEPSKLSDYIRQEKIRNFKRLPRLVGKRGPVHFTCPSCKKEGDTQTNYELTGTQICMCISLCWIGCYVCCCVPFCCCRMYNVKHSCPKCYYQLGESGK